MTRPPKESPALECLRRAGLWVQWNAIYIEPLEFFEGIGMQPKSQFYRALGRAMEGKR